MTCKQAALGALGQTSSSFENMLTANDISLIAKYMVGAYY